MALPMCFRPNARCIELLERIEEGYDVRHEEVMPLVRVGLAEIFVGPTSRSGYELTETGRKVLAEPR